MCSVLCCVQVRSLHINTFFGKKENYMFIERIRDEDIWRWNQESWQVKVQKWNWAVGLRHYKTILLAYVINVSGKNVVILLAVLVVVSWATRTADEAATKTHPVVEADILFEKEKNTKGRSQLPCGLRCGSETSRFLVLWFRIPPFAWVSVSCECCVLSVRGLCVRLINRQESVQPNVVCLNECDRKASITRRPWLTRRQTAHFHIVGLGSTSHGK
jgi:hypothetical protein